VNPVSAINLWDILQEHRRRWPSNEAAVDEDGKLRLTYPALAERVDRLTSALTHAGITSGDRILWLGQNSFRILELILAAAGIGAMVCPANWRQSPEELDFIIADAAPKLVVWQEPEIGERVRGTRAFLKTGRWLRHDADAGGLSEYEAFLVAAGPAAAHSFTDPASPVVMLYTAAFGGRPNGALISHNAIIGQSLVYAPARRITADYRYLNVGPMFHVATLMETLATFVMGGCNVFMPRNDPADVCRIIEAERIEGAFVIGPAAEQLAEANKDGRYNLKSLRALKGSDGWNAMVTVDDSPWGQKPFGYGQTETLGYATYSLLRGGGAMGRSSPVVLMRILDEAGNEVPDGEVGEIAVRSPTVSPGYWNRPELTAQRQGGGWHRTTDLGRREADGSISFIGPKGQLIKSAAENIYPAEVEACIRRHPAVKDVGVIGVPDPVWTQSVKAVVVLKSDASASEADIIEHCRASIASYKKPRIVSFVAELPRAGFAIDYAKLNADHGGGGYPGSG
jgi:acyl-CoA synthetase (AMP-forming)/AMP-acid ligase II